MVPEEICTSEHVQNLLSLSLLSGPPLPARNHGLVMILRQFIKGENLPQLKNSGNRVKRAPSTSPQILKIKIRHTCLCGLLVRTKSNSPLSSEKRNSWRENF
ncbi:hypothetical protein NPIL_387661 [Nephila pilipes]|uniref:Uncharacterized protein n=1 Tax=Nephila pilipes TaxID=299642 RepID=A0A8X6N3U8_NEPPI|nr:hypothetical protein NPIL_387661 [Nephila pilipes]